MNKLLYIDKEDRESEGIHAHVHIYKITEQQKWQQVDITISKTKHCKYYTLYNHYL